MLFGDMTSEQLGILTGMRDQDGIIDLERALSEMENTVDHRRVLVHLFQTEDIDQSMIDAAFSSWCREHYWMLISVSSQYVSDLDSHLRAAIAVSDVGLADYLYRLRDEPVSNAYKELALDTNHTNLPIASVEWLRSLQTRVSPDGLQDAARVRISNRYHRAMRQGLVPQDVHCNVVGEIINDLITGISSSSYFYRHWANNVDSLIYYSMWHRGYRHLYSTFPDTGVGYRKIMEWSETPEGQEHLAQIKDSEGQPIPLSTLVHKIDCPAVEALVHPAVFAPVIALVAKDPRGEDSLLERYEMMTKYFANVDGIDLGEPELKEYCVRVLLMRRGVPCADGRPTPHPRCSIRVFASARSARASFRHNADHEVMYLVAVWATTARDALNQILAHLLELLICYRLEFTMTGDMWILDDRARDTQAEIGQILTRIGLTKERSLSKSATSTTRCP